MRWGRNGVALRMLPQKEHHNCTVTRRLGPKQLEHLTEPGELFFRGRASQEHLRREQIRR